MGAWIGNSDFVLKYNVLIKYLESTVVKYIYENFV